MSMLSLWKGDDDMQKIYGASLAAKIPDMLGAVTKLKVRKGRIIAETESGISFACPIDPPRLVKLAPDAGEGEV